MHSVAATILVACVAPCHTAELTASDINDVQHSMDNPVEKLIDNLADKLFNQVLMASHLHTDLDNTAIGMPGQIAFPNSRLSPISSPVSQQQLLHKHKSEAAAAVNPRRRSHSGRPVVAAQALQEDGETVKEGSKEKKGGLFKAIFGNFDSFEDVMMDFAIGGKEKRWSPDRRPESEQGKAAGPGEHSRLSWGTPESIAEYREMAELQKQLCYDGASEKMQDMAQGNSGVAVFGTETCKAEELDLGLDEACRLAQVPGGVARTFAGPEEIAELLFGKYGHYHDVNMLRNVGQVGFNIYGPHLGMTNFPYTEEQYLAKLNNILTLLNDVDQAWFVKNFLLQPKKPRNMLPSSPRADTAMTIRLNLSPTWENEKDQAIVDEWEQKRYR